MLETVLHLYKILEFSDSEVEFLLQKGFRSPVTILSAYSSERIHRLECDEFPQGACDLLHRLGSCLLWYQTSHSNFDGLTSAFDTEFFETFNPNFVLKIPGATPNPKDMSPTERAERARMSVKLSDYPSFSGRTPDWSKWVEKFSATAELAKLGHLLEEHSDHEKRLEDDEEYKADCTALYSILKHSCAGGLAVHKVKKYKDSKDGYALYHDLRKSYYAHGHIEQYASNCLEKLLNLKLTRNFAGGMDAFLSKFQDLTLELETTHPLSEAQKKTFLLGNFQDPAYSGIVEICKANRTSYEETLLELTRISAE